MANMKKMHLPSSNGWQPLAILLLVLVPLFGASQTGEEWLPLLQSRYGAQASLHPATGKVRSLLFPPDRSLTLAGNTVQEKAWAFLYQYHSLWNIEDPTTSLHLHSIQHDKQGNTHVLFYQHHQGIPIFDGHINLHFSAAAALSAVTAVVVNVPTLPTTPAFSPAQAVEIAQSALFKETDVAYTPLDAPVLLYYHPGLARQHPDDVRLAYEVNLLSPGEERERVYINARTGGLIEIQAASCHARTRRLHNGNTNSAVLWQEGNALPGSLSAEQATIVQAGGQAYNFFYHALGRDSYNGGGATMVAVSNATNISCPNATWNGSSTNFCTGYGTDDIVAHEWAHAYTEYSSNLIYAWQAGAMNEAFSDIWGETVDLLNTIGNDSGDNTPRTACASSIRWALGEDLTANGIRDMWDPTCKSDPGKVSDGEYWCSTGDSGGVHTNSGVVNHAFALLVDGGTYNGYTLTGLGLTKAAHIFLRTHQYYLSRTSDFYALADALQAAGMALLNTNLSTLSVEDAAPGLSGEMITAADLVQLANVIDAVELRTEAPCAFAPLLDPVAPDICTVPNEDFQLLYVEDFEGGATGWTASEHPVVPATWNARSWSLDSFLPKGRSGAAMYGPNPANGDCNTDLENGTIMLTSPTISVPGAVTVPLYLTFDHLVAMESSWDGGLLQYQLNGGAWTDIAAGAFAYNAYNQNLQSVGAGNDNPLAGKAAFTGADGGAVSGSWGTSQVALGALGGQQLRLRWVLGSDGCNGWDGWYVDDIMIGGCAEAAFLPVTWSYFYAQANFHENHLKWATSQEWNNKGFHIERSTDNGRQFSTIGWVAAHGSDSEYVYADADVLPGHTYYYRLRQEDHDGTEAYSAIRWVKTTLLEPSQPDLLLYPNPADEVVFIQYLRTTAQDIAPRLYFADGRVARTWDKIAVLHPGEQIRLDIQGLQAGVYFLVLQSGNGQERIKLIVN